MRLNPSGCLAGVPCPRPRSSSCSGLRAPMASVARRHRPIGVVDRGASCRSFCASAALDVRDLNVGPHRPRRLGIIPGHISPVPTGACASRPAWSAPT